MKILVAAALSIILFSSAFSQDKRFANEDETWLKGYAYLASGEKVRGFINYQFVTETIKIKSGNTTKTYPAKNIKQFSVYDSAGNKSDYISFSLVHTEKPGFENGVYNAKLRTRNIYEGHHFLYVLYKNNRAAILANLDFEHETEGYTDQLSGVGGKGHKELLKERVYILDKRSIPFPTLKRVVDKKNRQKGWNSHYKLKFDPRTGQLTNKAERKLNDENPKYKLVNKDFLEELDPRNHRKLEAYVEKNEVDIKTIEGLTQLIDYWAEI